MDKKMIGIVSFYITYRPDQDPKPETLMELIRNYNSQLIKDLDAEGYKVMFVPVINESSRIEVVRVGT